MSNERPRSGERSAGDVMSFLLPGKSGAVDLGIPSDHELSFTGCAFVRALHASHMIFWRTHQRFMGKLRHPVADSSCTAILASTLA